MMLVWRATMSKRSGWKRNTQSSAEKDVEQCAQLGETENVSQQDYSAGHSPQFTDQSLSSESKKCCV